MLTESHNRDRSKEVSIPKEAIAADTRNVATFLLILVFFAFSDFYYAGFGRAFDYLGIAVAILLVVARRVEIDYGSALWRVYPAVVIVAPWAVAGLLSDQALPVIAILIGLTLIYPIFRFGEWFSAALVYRAVGAVALVNVALLIAQTAYYVWTGELLDFNLMVGSIESRGLNRALNYFRPSGLFQEPNMYCVALYALVVVRIAIVRRLASLDWLVLATMVATQSLWGFGAVGLVVWTVYGSLRLLIAGVAAASAAVVAFVAVGPPLYELSRQSVTLSRILNIGSDPSALARFGSGVEVDNLIALWGAGINTTEFQRLAANGLMFMLQSFGIVGVGLFVLWIILHEQLKKWYILLLVAFIFTTYPLLTYMYFWVWLALVVRFASSESDAPVWNAAIAPNVAGRKKR